MNGCVEIFSCNFWRTLALAPVLSLQIVFTDQTIPLLKTFSLLRLFQFIGSVASEALLLLHSIHEDQTSTLTFHVDGAPTRQHHHVGRRAGRSWGFHCGSNGSAGRCGAGGGGGGARVGVTYNNWKK